MCLFSATKYSNGSQNGECEYAGATAPAYS